MRNVIKWSIALVGVLVGSYALVFGFGIWASHETGKRLDIGSGSSTNSRLVRLEIGDKVFAIPQNHIWSREDWKGGKVEGVNLHALLPDFEPYTEKNRHEFDKPGWNRNVDLLLREHNIAGSRTAAPSMTRGEIYDRILYHSASQKPRRVTDHPGPFGLTLKQLEPSSSNDELYVGRRGDGGFYWVECSPDGSVKFPACSTYIEYSTQVTIHYTFAKSRLSDWQAIDDGILDFIRKFDNNAKQGEKQ